MAIAKVVVKKSMLEPDDDIAYWRTQKPEDRILALVQIRQEFHGWMDETEPRLPRIARVIRPA